MTSRDLASFLAELESAGVAEADISFGPADAPTKIRIRFDPRAVAEDPKVKAAREMGEDEMPPLADERAIDKLWKKNFPSSRG